MAQITTEQKSQLVSYLIGKGFILPDQQEAEIKKLAATVPEATVAEKNLDNDEAKAYEAMLILTGAQGGAPATQKTQNAADKTAPVSGVSAAEQMNITKKLSAQQATRELVSKNTTIQGYIFDRPAPSEVIKAGTKGEIVAKSFQALKKKVDEGKLIVCPDDDETVDASKRIASATNWDTLCKAFDAKQPVDVYVGELSTKPIGYTIIKGSANGKTGQAEQITRDDLMTFIALDTLGYVQATDRTPGVKLKMITVADKTPGAPRKYKTVMSDHNKKAAIESGSYQISREVIEETQTVTCKSALQVRFEDPTTKAADGVSNKKVTKRISVSAVVNKTQRKAEFVDVFKSGDAAAQQALIEPPTAEAQQKILAAQAQYIAQVRMSAGDPNSRLQQVYAANADKLAAFDMPGGSAPTPTV